MQIILAEVHDCLVLIANQDIRNFWEGLLDSRPLFAFVQEERLALPTQRHRCGSHRAVDAQALIFTAESEDKGFDHPGGGLACWIGSVLGTRGTLIEALFELLNLEIHLTQSPEFFAGPPLTTAPPQGH